jgi:hypothetical protein
MRVVGSVSAEMFEVSCLPKMPRSGEEKELDELLHPGDHIQPDEYGATYYVQVRASRPRGVSTMEPLLENQRASG